jgi:hypothetical protein
MPIAFSTDPRPAQPRAGLNLPPSLPEKCIYAWGGGLSLPWSTTVDLAGSFRSQLALTASGKPVPEQTGKLDSDTLHELVRLADQAWREPRHDARNPAAEYHEALTILDGKECYSLRVEGGIRGGAAAQLVARLRSLGEPLLALGFPENIKATSIDDELARKEWKAPSGLVVNPAVARVAGGKIVAGMTMENPGSKPVQLIVNPYGGPFPYGGTNPFRIELAASAPVGYTGETFPPEAPLPMRIEIPARSRVSFAAEIDLALYAWHGSPEIELGWAFHYFEGPAPGGTIRLTLPNRN